MSESRGLPPQLALAPRGPPQCSRGRTQATWRWLMASAQTLRLVCPAQAAGRSLVALARPRRRSRWPSAPLPLVCRHLAEADSAGSAPGVGDPRGQGVLARQLVGGGAWGRDLPASVLYRHLLAATPQEPTGPPAGKTDPGPSVSGSYRAIVHFLLEPREQLTLPASLPPAGVAAHPGARGLERAPQ